MVGHNETNGMHPRSLITNQDEEILIKMLWQLIFEILEGICVCMEQTMLRLRAMSPA